MAGNIYGISSGHLMGVPVATLRHRLVKVFMTEDVCEARWRAVGGTAVGRIVHLKPATPVEEWRCGLW